MVRREESVSSFTTLASPELEAPPRACRASHVRVPPTSVTLKSKTVETLVSWGALPSSLQEGVPYNGLVVLNRPRSLHLRSGLGVAEVLTLALERRDSRALPDLRGFSHATNPAAFATNWRNLRPYVESIGIWIGETWSKALERGDADAVGRLVDFIADRQTSYERNVLAYDNTPLPIPEASNITAARASEPGTARGLHDTLVNSSSWPSQQSAMTSTKASPADPARTGNGTCAVKDDGAVADNRRLLPSHSERSHTAASRELTRAAAPSLPELSAAEVQAHLRKSQGQQSRPPLELTEPHCEKAKTPVAPKSPAAGTLPSSDLEITRKAASVQLQPNEAQDVQVKATQLTANASTTGAAVIAAVRLKQAECQTDIAGPHAAPSASAQPTLPLLLDSQRNDNSKDIYQSTFSDHRGDEGLLYPLRQSTSLALDAEGRCRDDAASFNLLAFNPVECLATAAPLRVESNPLLEEIPLEQRQSENSRQQQERTHNINIKQPESGELTAHVQTKSEVPLLASTFGHRHLNETEPVASVCYQDKEAAYQEAETGSCWPPKGITQSQTQLIKAFDAIAIEDHKAQVQAKHKGFNEVDDEPLEAEELYEETITSQTAEDSPAIAAPQSLIEAESGGCHSAPLRHERQPTARRRTSSIFKAAAGDWSLSQDAPFLASIVRQQQLQQADTQGQQQADSVKRWVQEHQDFGDSWPHKENVEELLLQSLKKHFGFDRRTSIQVVQQKGQLLEALFARAGKHAFAQGAAGWIGSLRESAATAAERLEGEPQKTGIVMQIYYNGATFLHRQGQLLHATALLKALSVLLLELNPASEALQQRLVCHLRRSTAAVSIAQLAAAAAESEAYVHSKATTEMLAAIGSLCHQWCQMEPSNIWSGGFLRKAIGCDISYFLLARLLLQQNQRMQTQHQLEGKTSASLPINFLRAIAVEACTAVSTVLPAIVFFRCLVVFLAAPFPCRCFRPRHACGSTALGVAAAVCLQAVQQNNADSERAAALLVLGPISLCCCSTLVHEEHEVVLHLMRQLSRCIRLATAIEGTAARQSLADLILAAAETGSSELAITVLEDAATLGELLPGLRLIAAAEKGVCTPASVIAALASAISATITPIERAGAVDNIPGKAFRHRSADAPSLTAFEMPAALDEEFATCCASGVLASPAPLGNWQPRFFRP
ncbi:hypothetical protein Emed_005760 [Eimeria media]